LPNREKGAEVITMCAQAAQLGHPPSRARATVSKKNGRGFSVRFNKYRMLGKEETLLFLWIFEDKKSGDNKGSIFGIAYLDQAISGEKKWMPTTLPTSIETLLGELMIKIRTG
jgi:hypothetical protein